jgi:hypothetical protein
MKTSAIMVTNFRSDFVTDDNILNKRFKIFIKLFLYVTFYFQKFFTE